MIRELLSFNYSDSIYITCLRRMYLYLYLEFNTFSKLSKK